MSLEVSIIIINYNYGRFISDAIESSIHQNYANVEVIVVDDGSLDNSREVIDSFGKSIKKIYKPNTGMMDSANVGFAESTGNIIIFVDADDYLKVTAVSEIVSNWREGISKLHYRLDLINRDGEKIGFKPPLKEKLSQGKVWREILITGQYITSPTIGNAFSRSILEAIFPIKDAKINDSGTYYDIIPTDAYLKYRVPFFGEVVAIQKSLAFKRIHGDNNTGNSPYLNQNKRQRYLRLAKLNMAFVHQKLQNEKVKVEKNFLFRKKKLLKLRILSLRFDGTKHPWPEDSRLRLIIFSLTFIRVQKLSFLTKDLYHLFVILLLTFLPQKYVLLILKREES